MPTYLTYYVDGQECRIDDLTSADIPAASDIDKQLYDAYPKLLWKAPFWRKLLARAHTALATRVMHDGKEKLLGHMVVAQPSSKSQFNNYPGDLIIYTLSVDPKYHEQLHARRLLEVLANKFKPLADKYYAHCAHMAQNITIRYSNPADLSLSPNVLRLLGFKDVPVPRGDRAINVATSRVTIYLQTTALDLALKFQSHEYTITQNFENYAAIPVAQPAAIISTSATAIPVAQPKSMFFGTSRRTSTAVTVDLEANNNSLLTPLLTTAMPTPQGQKSASSSQLLRASQAAPTMRPVQQHTAASLPKGYVIGVPVVQGLPVVKANVLPTAPTSDLLLMPEAPKHEVNIDSSKTEETTTKKKIAFLS